MQKKAYSPAQSFGEGVDQRSKLFKINLWILPPAWLSRSATVTNIFEIDGWITS